MTMCRTWGFVTGILNYLIIISRSKATRLGTSLKKRRVLILCFLPPHYPMFVVNISPFGEFR